MNRDLYKSAIWLMWLALPISALNYGRAWDRFPTRLAVRFDANWQPNGYTSREAALMLGLGIMAVMLLLFTVGGLIVHALKPSAAWPMLVLFYVVLGLLCYGNYSIVKWNRDRNDEPHGLNLTPHRKTRTSHAVGTTSAQPGS
jgi:hypothetical protein